VTPLRIGVVGTGNFGVKHIAAYARRQNVELVGVVDRDLERARSAAQSWGIDHWYSETSDLLRERRPDGISVVTSGANHLRPALAALAAGCSVLLEKPLTLSTREADELVAAERRSSGFIMPAHILRFAGPYQELVARVHGGEIGRVLALATVRDRGRDHETLFPDVHPALMTTIHDIDVALWVTRSRAVRVSAHARGGEAADRPRLLWARIEAADGSIWTLHISWLLSDNAPGGDRLEVYGSDGVAKLALAPSVTVFTDRPKWIDHELTPDAHKGALDAEIETFLDRMQVRTLPPVVTLEEARHGIEIAEAIVASALNGGVTVELPG